MKNSKIKIDYLFCLVKENNDDFIKNLKIISQEINVKNIKDEYDNTLLHYACRNRNYKFTKILIQEYKLKPYYQNIEKKTPLHMICMYASCNPLSFLFLNINIVDIIKIIKLIIKDYTFIIFMKDNNKNSPLDYIEDSLIYDKRIKDIQVKLTNKYRKINNFYEKAKLDVNDYVKEKILKC